MPNDIGMNKIVCSDEGRSGIRNAPVDPVENYPIYRGCGIGGRNHDIQTSQTLSNGVVLYYTATTGSSRRTTKTSSTIRGRRPSPSSGGLTKPAQLATKRRTRASAASPHELGGVRTHQGLGALDELPVPPEVIMSHGGVRGMQAAAFVELCSGIARRCPVLAFQKDRSDDKDEMVNRTAGFTYFWLDVNGFARAMGGRSRGARCATQASVYSSNKNLILWSYPLVRDYEVRKQELLALSSDTRVLFVKGTKDWMAPEIIFGPVRREMKAKSWCIYVQDMDHNFNCKTPLQEEKLCNAIGTMAGIWLSGDPDKGNAPWSPNDGTEMGMAWDAEREEAVWTEWQVRGDKPPKADVVKHDVAGLD